MLADIKELNEYCIVIKRNINMQAIETLTKDSFLKLKDTSKKVYLTKGYCRINKAYECGNWNDISDSIYLKKGKQVFTNFEF